MMRAGPPPVSPDAYVKSLTGWQRERVTALRAVVQAAGAEEVIKWGHLVYLANGPAFLVRAEETRVIFGFWRGKQLQQVEPRLKPSGKYEMARVDLTQQETIDATTAERLAREAVDLNRRLGDPTKL
jgi:hypothetical protein